MNKPMKNWYDWYELRHPVTKTRVHFIKEDELDKMRLGELRRRLNKLYDEFPEYDDFRLVYNHEYPDESPWYSVEVYREETEEDVAIREQKNREFEELERAVYERLKEKYG